MTRITLEIVESAYEPTADGQGMVLRCLTQEIAGREEGRLAYLNLVLDHADDDVQERGQRDFAALRLAIGVLNPDDSSELHWRAFQVRAGLKTNSRGEPESVIEEYIPSPLAA